MTNPFNQLHIFEADDVALNVQTDPACVIFDVAGVRYGFSLKRPQLVDLALQIEQQIGGVLLPARPPTKKKT